MVIITVLKTMMMFLFHPDKIHKRICQFYFHFLVTAQCAVHTIWPKLSSGEFRLWTGLTLMTWFWNLCLQEPETEMCDYYESDLAEMLVGQCSGQADSIWQYFGLGWAMLWARSRSSGQHFGKGCRAAQVKHGRAAFTGQAKVVNLLKSTMIVSKCSSNKKNAPNST